MAWRLIDNKTLPKPKLIKMFNTIASLGHNYLKHEVAMDSEIMI